MESWQCEVGWKGLLGDSEWALWADLGVWEKMIFGESWERYKEIEDSKSKGLELGLWEKRLKCQGTSVFECNLSLVPGPWRRKDGGRRPVQPELQARSEQPLSSL